MLFDFVSLPTQLTETVVSIVKLVVKVLLCPLLGHLCLILLKYFVGAFIIITVVFGLVLSTLNMW